MVSDNFLKAIRAEDLSEYPDVVDLIDEFGFDLVIRFLGRAGGSTRYLPALNRRGDLIKRFIEANPGKSARWIAYETGRTEKFVKEFMRKHNLVK